MAHLTAAQLRDSARGAMLQAGGRGFMRFCGDEGAGDFEALLASDALRRCADESERSRLIRAMEGCGFAWHERDGLLLLTPQDELLRALGGQERPEVNWDSPLCAAQTLAARWQSMPPLPFTADGRRLVIRTLRLTGKPGGDVPGGLDALRAQAAVMLRRGDRSGMHEAGSALARWGREAE